MTYQQETEASEMLKAFMAELSATLEDTLEKARRGAQGRLTSEIDLDELLASHQQIALIWSVEDVQEVRPDLTAEQAWEVLKQVKRDHDATAGVTWDTLEWAAQDLFGDAPKTHEEE